MDLNELTKAGEKVTKISVEAMLGELMEVPLIDVRSPAEFEKAHIPGAVNIPLFNNEERAMVGTTYKQTSREKAIELGYRLVQPKLQGFIEDARKIAPDGNAMVHCWRGGMRSAAFARHLSENGFSNVRVAEGGYKAYRNHVHAFFQKPFRLHIIGGFTGSGKTEILHYLNKNGQQVLDLEDLARHRGSAFGGIDLPTQPSVEMFENLLFDALRKLNTEEPVWVEDESHYIGSVFIPNDFFRHIKEQRLYFINIPREERALHLVNTYGSLNKEGLTDAIKKISKRMGYDKAKQALLQLEKENYYEVEMLCLTYYDKFYLKGLSMRNPDRVTEIPFPEANHEKNAKELFRIVSIINQNEARRN